MFAVKEDVFARNYGPGAKWTPGLIEKQTGPVSFLVNFADGRLHRCPQDQVRKCLVHVEMELEKTNTDLNFGLTV